MSERTIWTCDGCGDEKVVSGQHRVGDWNCIEITLDGFRGYPVGESGNTTASHHLCPECQLHIHEVSNPRTWPRAAKEEPAQ